jgi:hypothetical protein
MGTTGRPSSLQKQRQLGLVLQSAPPVLLLPVLVLLLQMRPVLRYPIRLRPQANRQRLRRLSAHATKTDG